MNKPRIWTDDENFLIDLKGSGWGVLFAFSKEELAKGASLQRMMNIKVRETQRNSGWVVSLDDIKDAARKAMPFLRAEVESYFEARA
ncbi:hypothetical protein RPALISO_128 [Ruegeria phage RpAliso]|nr:hypothetical protein RPALISO_128 [Ruegeria phage RpAliso]